MNDSVKLFCFLLNCTFQTITTKLFIIVCALYRSNKCTKFIYSVKTHGCTFKKRADPKHKLYAAGNV